MSLSIVQAPVEPITLSQARMQCRADDDGYNDAMLSACIAAAGTQIDIRARTRLMAAIVDEDVTVASTSTAITLTAPHVSSLLSVGYIDANGAPQVLSASTYKLTGQVLAPVSSWPEDMTMAIIRYQSGVYLAAEQVPADAQMWMLMVVAFLFRQREQFDTTGKLAEIPNGFHDGLLDSVLKSSAKYVFA